jgi:hypothetical protein
MKKLPKSVLKLLALEWRPTGGYSGFDAVFNDDCKNHTRRKFDPSYYHHRQDAPDYVNNGLTYEEVKGLVADGVLFDHSHKPQVVVINEHEQLALNDFGSEVRDAWDKFQARLELARSTHGMDRDAQPWLGSGGGARTHKSPSA